MVHIVDGIIYFHCYKMWVQFTSLCSMVSATICECNSSVHVQWSLLQNVSTIHSSLMVIATKCGHNSLVLFNGHCYKIWVQFTYPYSMDWSLMVIATKCEHNSIVLFNGHCYKMWVQFSYPYSMDWSLMVIATKCEHNSVVLFNGHCYKMWVQFTYPFSMDWSNGHCYKIWAQFSSPVQWSLLQNVGAIHDPYSMN
jgi:beta-xylosidase